MLFGFYLPLVLIQEFLRNSRTHRESWGIHYFHICVFSNLTAESPAARLLSFAKFSGATIPRMKPPGNERMIFAKTTHTYFLANPNLEGEIHLKGGRFVTSQIFNLECYT